MGKASPGRGLTLLPSYLRSCSSAKTAGMWPGEFWGCGGAGGEQDPKTQRGKPGLQRHPHTHQCPCLGGQMHRENTQGGDAFIFIYKCVYFVHLSTSVRPSDPQAGTAGTQRRLSHAWAPPERHWGVPGALPQPWPPWRCVGSVLRASPRLLPVLGALAGEKCGERRFSLRSLLWGPPAGTPDGPRCPRGAQKARQGQSGHRGCLESDPRGLTGFF